ncbi:MAG: hypothetical protein NTV60_01385 [Candidatus Kaiserbacteria bacterium]|nr:hypothetical protein [Candidatus Kaiserbacteria bacterium]
MKNVIVSEYESKRWYRLIKTFYIFFFVFALLWGNIACLVDGGSPPWVFVVTNLGIIFTMGTIEGLFWYIVRGKWGYPKDTEYNDLEKIINDCLLTKEDLLNLEETVNWNTIQIGDNFLANLPQDTENTEKDNQYIIKIANQDISVDFEEINIESHTDGAEAVKGLIDKYFKETLSDLLSFGVKKENVTFLASRIINTDLIWYRASVSCKEKVDGLPLVFDDIHVGDKWVKDFVRPKSPRNKHILEFIYRYNDDQSGSKQITKTINNITKSLKLVS